MDTNPSEHAAIHFNPVASRSRPDYYEGAANCDACRKPPVALPPPAASFLRFDGRGRYSRAIERALTIDRQVVSL
jgi:hypothetical protein